MSIKDLSQEELKELITTYYRQVEQITNNLPSSEVITSHRHGAKKFRDHAVMLRAAWAEAYSFLALPYVFLGMLAWTPLALATINFFLKYVGVQLPVMLSTLFALLIILGVLVVGILGYSRWGTAKRGSEIGAKLSLADITEITRIYVIEKRLESMATKDDIEELRKLIQDKL